VARDFHNVVQSPGFADVYQPLRDTGRLPAQFLATLVRLLKSDHLRVKEEADVLHAILEHMRIVVEATEKAEPSTAEAKAALEEEFHEVH
jgi:hypothetical protein